MDTQEINKSILYDSFPTWIIFISNFTPILTYTLAIFIIWKLSWILVMLFLLYILYLEYRLIKNHCVDCYYYGKACGFGKGKLSALFFKKGNPELFCNRQITWKNMIPDMMVTIIPLSIGIVSLIIDFNWMILLALLVILILSSIGNGVIRGALTCKYCKQKELGCPAEKLFNKSKAP